MWIDINEQQETRAKLVANQWEGLPLWVRVQHDNCHNWYTSDLINE